MRRESSLTLSASGRNVRSKDGPRPLGELCPSPVICGAPVREREKRVEQSLANEITTTTGVRICTNPRCPSNTGQMSLAEVV